MASEKVEEGVLRLVVVLEDSSQLAVTAKMFTASSLFAEFSSDVSTIRILR